MGGVFVVPDGSKGLLWLGLFVASVLFTANMLALLVPAERAYSPPPLAPAPIVQRLGEGYGGDLGVEVLGEKAVSFGGVDIVVKNITYRHPDGDCPIYAWVYRAVGVKNTPIAILVHGLGGDHRFWEEGAHPLAYMLAAEGYTVLALDAPGHGNSCLVGAGDIAAAASTFSPVERNLFYQVYRATLRAVEVAKSLEDVDKTKIMIVGVSMGGMTAYVVGSIHPDVKLAVPIVASGCISCMIESGGLANLLGGPELTLDSPAAVNLSVIDPLTYVTRAKSGKYFLILFSTHDQYFTLEGLKMTVDALRGSGASVAVVLAANNDHYHLGRGWVEDMLAAARALRDDRLDALFSLNPGEPAHLPMTLFHGNLFMFRVGVKGYPFLGPTIAMILFAPLEAYSVLTTQEFYVTGLPALYGFTESVFIILVALLVMIFLAASLARGYLPAGLGIASLIAAVIGQSMPVAEWQGRFTVTYLDIVERFGVTLTEKIGVDMLYTTMTVSLVAPFMLLAASALRPKAGMPLAIAGAALLLLPIEVSRLVYPTIASVVGVSLPITSLWMAEVLVGLGAALSIAASVLGSRR